MRYYVTVHGREKPTSVEVEQTDNGRFKVIIDGRALEVDALLDRGMASLLIDGNSYAAEFEDLGDALNVLVKDQITRMDVADERQFGARKTPVGVSPSGPQTITAPMPGKVVRVLTHVGAQVAAGQGLIVIEAMKMENELKSPKAGKVIGLFVREGTAVENNAKLMVIE